MVAVHQVVADVPLGFPSCQVASWWNPFRLEAAKQALHWRVIPAVPSTAHALLHPVAPEPLSEQAAGVLAALDALLKIKR